MAKVRKRLDDLLVELGYFAEPKDALGPIMAGDVTVAGVRVTKAGSKVPVDATISVGGRTLEYASRGGYKLAHALRVFGVDVRGMTVLDAGASTGGFTDCLLQHGAARVYAVDVGFGQLRGKLAADGRVVVREKTNISDLLEDGIAEPVQLCTLDLSYLSLLTAIPIIHEAVGATRFICLVKPLYEGLAEAHKADMDAIAEVAATFFTRLGALGYKCRDVVVSPNLGGRGAVEFLIDVERGRGTREARSLVARLRDDWRAHPPAPQ